ncbi:hypothetical protein BU16DRAFT_527886 [Lophium mytilinum]|uniref:Uncharacterized protein n=1 Tax=Lophium mytilinum TaxID=390894 RepID=A0A6A6QRI0_9PEZI|nr:hypothetical protein BU16DRAFT_527886 [Lophium mytilinum]
MSLRTARAWFRALHRKEPCDILRDGSQGGVHVLRMEHAGVFGLVSLMPALIMALKASKATAPDSQAFSHRGTGTGRAKVMQKSTILHLSGYSLGGCSHKSSIEYGGG